MTAVQSADEWMPSPVQPSTAQHSLEFAVIMWTAGGLVLAEVIREYFALSKDCSCHAYAGAHRNAGRAQQGRCMNQEVLARIVETEC